VHKHTHNNGTVSLTLTENLNIKHKTQKQHKPKIVRPCHYNCAYARLTAVLTRGCGCWGLARYGAVLAVEYVRAVLGLSRSVQGGKGSLRHLPNIKLIGQQAANLWGFFDNNAISCHDLDLDLLILKLVHGVLVSQGPFLPSLVFVGLFVFPLGGGTGQTDRRTDRINTWWGLLLGRTTP